ncbi:MAG: MBL fold metallo-hydrolase [Bacilli bacterium]|nr:MBL fold metallo-hydrolase [Bacilli bacterium]
MNHFIFHNVGQGLFYSGHLNNNGFNFIYDCGSDSAAKYLDNAIDNQLPSQDIDFIVISHLHKDHISGLKRLMNNYNVKKIYLPYYGSGNTSLVKLLCAAASIPDKQFIKGLSESEVREIFIVEYKFLYSFYDTQKNTEISEKIEFIVESDNKKSDWSSPSYPEITIPYPNKLTVYWKFIMFNRTQSQSDLHKLNSKINSLITTGAYSSIDDVISNGDIGKITQIYKSVFGANHRKQNLTSTILIHYPMVEKPPFLFPYPCQFLCDRIEIHNRAASILTGDAEFDNILLQKMDQHLLASNCGFSIFQAPHHGAKTNWNSLTNTHKFIFSRYVVPCGIGRPNHPSKDLIRDLSILKTDAVSFANELNQFEYFIT